MGREVFGVRYSVFGVRCRLELNQYTEGTEGFIGFRISDFRIRGFIKLVMGGWGLWCLEIETALRALSSAIRRSLQFATLTS